MIDDDMDANAIDKRRHAGPNDPFASQVHAVSGLIGGPDVAA